MVISADAPHRVRRSPRLRNPRRGGAEFGAQQRQPGAEVEGKASFNEIDLVSGAGGRVTSRSGIAVDTQRIGELSSRAVDTLLIAGAERGPLIEAMTDPEMRKALPQVTGKVERFGSVCTGAFFLAASACSTAIASPPIGMPANRWPERSRH